MAEMGVELRVERKSMKGLGEDMFMISVCNLFSLGGDNVPVKHGSKPHWQ